MPRARFVPLLLIVLLAAGCNGVAPGSDPVLVRAEQGQQAAHAVVKLLLTVEHQNRDFVRQELPEVHAAAESIRRRYPQIIRDVIAAEDLYRISGSTADGDALASKRNLLDGIADEAKLLLMKINERKARSP